MTGRDGTARRGDRSGLRVPELAVVEIGGLTRSSFILRSALAAGAVYGGAAVGPFVRRAMAQEDSEPPDLDILNFALTLEMLEAAFYEQAVQQLGLSGEVGSLAQELRDNEQEHVDFLTETIEDIGGEPIDEPDFDFGGAFGSESSFLDLAQTFEDTGVSAYNGVAPSIQDKDVLAGAGSIVQVEGRHAALVRAARGEDPAPTAFDETLSRSEVTDSISRYIQ